MYEFSDEEPYEKMTYPVAVQDISHFYWDEDGLCVLVHRRSDESLYREEFSTRFSNARKEIEDAIGLVQLSDDVLVPVKNIRGVREAGGVTEVDIGDCYVEETSIPIAELIRIIRNEYVRVYGRADEKLINDFNDTIRDHGGTPFLPGF
jgi:hypothetical protein